MADLPDDSSHAYKEWKMESETAGSLLFQFVNRIKQSFQSVPKEPEGVLTGRVLQFNQTMSAILQKLNDIKEKIGNKTDTELFMHVENLMDPLTRDATNIQKLLTQQSSPVQQAKVYKKYHAWVTKATLWIELEDKVADSQVIVDAVIHHHFHGLNDLVDQDLQIIKDYEVNTIETLPLNEEETITLKKQIEIELLPVLNKLMSLKDKPSIENLDILFKWIDEVDRHRSQLFDKSLHIIDQMVHAVSPESETEEGHEHLVEVLGQIAFLEEEIPQVIAEFQMRDQLTDERKHLVEMRRRALEEELHALNLNLRLTPDLCERLQRLLSLLSI